MLLKLLSLSTILLPLLPLMTQTLRHYNQRVTGNDFDEEGNTLGHIAARSGNVNLFKVPSYKQLIHSEACRCKKYIYTVYKCLTHCQVVFPLESLGELSTESIACKVSSLNKFENFSNCSMFWSLILENRKRETPLMVAIDNNHYK